MRITRLVVATIGIISLTQLSGQSEENPTPDTKSAKPGLVRRLSAEDIRNPIVQRIDALTWDDQEIMDALKTFDPKRQAALLKQREKAKQTKVPYQIRNVIKLRYLDDGGAVLPMSDEPTPWIYANEQPIVSLGLIPCYNSMVQATSVSKESGRPILVISTELPGCGACTGLGHRQLSHPLVVDATMEFTPVVIAGSWPWLQVRDADGKPVGDKVNHKSSIGDLLKMMRDGLQATKRDVPEWLDLVTDEYNARREATAFAMGCFWSGERKLGGIDGVISTRVGNRQGKGEWVEVEFDRDVISYDALVKAASEMKCTSAIVARTDKQAEIAKDYVSQPERLYRDDQSLINPPKNPSADKHSIYSSRRYGNLPMTPRQATRVNAHGKSAEKYLSPSQLILAQKLDERMAGGAEVRNFPKPDWIALESLEDDARALQAKLEMCPERVW